VQLTILFIPHTDHQQKMIVEESGSGGIDPCPANMYYADGECHLITLPTINGTRTGTEAKEFIETTFDKILNIGQNIYPQNPGGGWDSIFCNINNTICWC